MAKKPRSEWKKPDKRSNVERLEEAFPTDELEVGDRIWIQRIAVYGRVLGFTRNDEVRYMPTEGPGLCRLCPGEKICDKTDASFMPSMDEIYGEIRDRIQGTWSKADWQGRAGSNKSYAVDIEQQLKRSTGTRKGNNQGNGNS